MFRGLLQSIFIMANVGDLIEKNNISNGYYDQSCRWPDISDFCKNLQNFSNFLTVHLGSQMASPGGFKRSLQLVIVRRSILHNRVTKVFFTNHLLLVIVIIYMNKLASRSSDQTEFLLICVSRDQPAIQTQKGKVISSPLPRRHCKHKPLNTGVWTRT